MTLASASGPDRPGPVSSRFHLREMLGSGSSKRVYRARDVVLRRDVALSLYHDRVGTAVLERAMREAQAMARVSQHEAVVSIFDVIEREGRLCIVAAYLPGGTLRERLASGAMGVTRSVRIAARIASALAAAHARGLVHRDVKPENILFDSEDEACLADFGIATLEEELAAAVPPVGTPAYAAPEQLDGHASPQSDLYALGCVLYEMLTGRAPFEGSVDALIAHHRHSDPVAPRDRDPAIPPALSHLCLALMAKEPAARPGSARQVVEILRHASARGPAARGAGSTAARIRWVQPEAGGFVARQREIARCDAWLAERTGRFVLIEGEPGVGKTTLGRELASCAQARGYSVWRGAALENSGVPLKPIRDLLLPRRSALEVRVPSVARLFGELGVRAAAEGFEALLHALAAGLVEWARDEPLLLWLDDLQWADRPTLRLLDDLSARLGEHDVPLVVAATLRPVEEDSDLAPSLTAWRRLDRTRSLHLEAFDEHATRALLQSLTGIAPSTRLLEMLQEVARGNALFVRELLIHLDETGRLEEHDGQLWTSADARELDLPSSLHAMIGLLLHTLTPGALATLRIAACVGAEFRLPLLGALTDSALPAQLEELERARIVTGEGEEYAFRHPLIHHGVYDGLSNAERMHTHGRIARALLALGGERAETRIEAAHHAALAFDFFGSELSVELMLRACQDAIDHLAWDDAIRFCEAVLDRAQAGHDVDDRQRMRLHYLAGTAYHQVAEVDRAIHHFGAAGDLARALDDPTLLGWVLWERIRMEIHFGRVSAGETPDTRQLELLISRFETSDPALAARLIIALSSRLFLAARYRDAELWADAACRLAREIDDPELVARSGAWRGYVHWELLEPEAGLAALRASERAAERISDTARRARSLQRIPPTLLMLGRVEEVGHAAVDARRASAGIRRTGELTLSMAAEVCASLVQGDLRSAARLAREANDLRRETDYVGAGLWLCSASAYTAAMLEDWSSAREALLELAGGHDAAGPTGFERIALRYEALLRALEGKRGDVAAWLREHRRGPPRGRLPLGRVISYCITLETAWEVGEDAIGALCRGAVDTASASGLVLTPGWPFLIPRLQACAAAMAGDAAAAERHFVEAVMRCRAHRMDAELGKTYLHLERFSRTRAGGARSRDGVRQRAEDLLDRCGLTPYRTALDSTPIER